MSTHNEPKCGPSSHTTRKRARTNVQRACDNCRDRRVKCDGVRPSCGTCGVYKDDCQWDSREDYRKPLPRQQVQALVTRVDYLERLLKEHGIETGPTGGRHHSLDHGRDVTQDQDRRDGLEGGDTSRDLSLDHLVEREDGNVYLHGPTSAFRHLGKHPRDRSNGLNIYPTPTSRGPLQFGHSRYLPVEIQLSQEEHDQCLDRFFGYYACWGMRSNALLFKHDMALALDNPYPRTPHYSPMLHNAILAIALGLSDDPFLRLASTRAIFGTQAKSFIEEEGMTPSVATVQAFAHIASYHSLGAEHNLGWLYIGMALRCAIALGLNTESAYLLERGQIPMVQAKERNTTFWTIFVQEGVWAPYIGRSMSTPAYTTRLPSIDPELDRLEWHPITPGTRGTLFPQPGMLSTTFVHTVQLMLIGERIMNTLYGIKAEIPKRERTAAISDIGTALERWLADLPSSLALDIESPSNALPHILMIHLSHAWLIILLYRPFYRPFAGLLGSDKPAEADTILSGRVAWAVKQCDHAANKVINLLRIWHTYHDLRFSPPTALQICFVAGTTHLLSLASARSNSKQEAESLSRVEECLELLKLIAASWPAAEQAGMLLDGLREDYGFSGASTITGKGKPGQSAFPETSTRYSPVPNQRPLPWQMNDNEASLDNLTNQHRPFKVDNYLDPTLGAGLNVGQVHFNYTDYPEETANAFAARDESGPPLASGSFDWDDLDFGLGIDNPEHAHVDPELQALLDTILQPHLNIGIGGYDTGFTLP